MWAAKLSDGRLFTHRDGTFLDIDQPIEELRVGEKAVTGAEAYYLVFHASARPGQALPTVRAIEFGGVFGTQARGYIVTPGGILAKDYPLAVFPYAGALKPGIKSN